MDKYLHKNITRKTSNVLHNTEGGLHWWQGIYFCVWRKVYAYDGVNYSQGAFQSSVWGIGDISDNKNHPLVDDILFEPQGEFLHNVPELD